MTRSTLIRARPPIARPPATQAVPTLESIGSLLDIPVDTASMRLYPNERNVHGLAGAWAALLKISNACAQMMVGADAYGPDGITELTPAPTVLDEPCTGYDPFVYWKEVFSHGVARGNWIGIKYDYDPVSFYPRQVLPVPMDSVYAYYDDEGFPRYQIGARDFAATDVVHIRFGLTIPGQIMAIGPIEAHRRGLQGHLDQQGMAGSVWREGAVPAGIVQLDIDQPTTDQANTVKTNWVSAHGGRRTVGVVGKKMSYTPIAWSAEDAQFLESRQFTIAECALMFGLRPEDVGASFAGSSGAQSYGNRTDDALQRIVDSYTPVMLPVEQAWSRLIPGRNFIRGDAEALLRSTPKDRLEVTQLRQAVGLETVDESRAAAGMPALGTPPAPPVTDPHQNPEQDINE